MSRKFGSGSRRFDDEWPFPRTTPISVRGGIKAQTERGTFGAHWWGKQWIAVLEGLSLGSRLQRGRSYARKGQVLDLTIESGRVTATVQGSRPTPYRATIKMQTLDANAWGRVLEAIGAQTRFAAKLVAGEMPHEIEEAFVAAGSSLFPRSARDLQTACSCPDASTPCKHLAAVYYLLGEEFDRDPFLLFTLRGRTRDEVMAALERRDPDGRLADDVAVAELEVDAALTSDDIESFWSGAATASSPPPPSATVASSIATRGRRSVPPLAFWRGEESLPAAVSRIDERAKDEAMRLLDPLLER